MNPRVYANLVASSVFDKFPEETHQFIPSTMSGPGDTNSTGGAVTSEGAAPKVMSMKNPAAMPTAPRSPRPKPMMVREDPKPKKDK